MDEEIVTAMREALTPPWSWTHRASPTAADVLRRLGELGYEVTPRAAVAETVDAPPVALHAVPGQRTLADLMDQVGAGVAAAREADAAESRTDRSSWGA